MGIPAPGSLRRGLPKVFWRKPKPDLGRNAANKVTTIHLVSQGHRVTGCFTRGDHSFLTNAGSLCLADKSLLYEAGPLGGRGRPRRWVKQREVKTHTPIGAIAWRVGIVFAADLQADRLPPNF